MILLENLFDFLEFCAENNTYIEHQPGTTGLTNRFSRYKLESDTGQQSNFGYPRMEVLQLPFGNVTAFDSSDRDDMEVRLRVIYSLSDKYDYSAQTTAMDNAKQALMEMVNYILTAQQDNTENALLCAFDPNDIRYRFIDRATYGGDAVGCELSLQFRQYIDWENLVYGDLPGYTTFEDRVEDALNTPSANGQYVLTVTGNVISWEEFSASGLVDGNGTTVNGNKVDLGGTVTEDIGLDYSPLVNFIYLGDTDTGDGFYVGNLLTDGVSRVGASGMDIVLFSGQNGDNSYEISAAKEDAQGFPITDINVKNDGCVYGLYNFENGGRKTANIYYALTDGVSVTDISRVEANKFEVHGRKLIDDTGVLTNYNGWLANNDYTQLEYNKVLEDGQATGTLWTLNEDGASHYQDGSILNQFDNSGNLLFGDPITDGTWKFDISGGNFSIQKRVSGSWVTKQLWT